jgi:Holliday junction resolvase RusA-like endonuclease
MNGAPLLDRALCLFLEARMSIPSSWSKKKHALALRGSLRPTGRPDLDNLAKIVDALKGVVWVDDSLIVDLHASRSIRRLPAYSSKFGRLPIFSVDAP